VIDGVHIWHAALDEPGWPGSEGLPPEERERASGFLRAEAGRRWVASRWALRQVLAGYLGQPPSAIAIEVGEGGKPRLADGELQFNLSHSGDLALVAVSEDRSVGVDVERIRPGRDLLALAERALGAEDVAAVRAAAPGDRAAVFYAAWVRHEARLKCLGTGLSGPASESPAIVEEVDAGSGYAAAVAIAGTEPATLQVQAPAPS
jgi:4'-phosphopantetheinyl transferase